MSHATFPITEDELLHKLRRSAIEQEQQSKLEKLIPNMNQEERRKLMNLIQKACPKKKAGIIAVLILLIGIAGIALYALKLV